MLVKELDETVIHEIGHAFGYYDYGDEKGLDACFSSKDAVATYICGYVRCVLAGGFLHTTSERGEGYIAYKLPGQKIPPRTMIPLVRGVFQSMSLKEVVRFAKAMAKGGPSLNELMEKKKTPFIWAWSV